MFCKIQPNARARGRARQNLESDIELSGIDLDADSIAGAANGAAILAVSVLAAIAALAWLSGASRVVLPAALGSLALGFIVRAAVLWHPSSAARKRAEQVLKDSTRATNLMIMSLGHEPSISKAIAFAARAEGPFSEELRRCVWSVVMGRCESFEEALHDLGGRWARFGGELKSTLNSMVTASCEATDDGRRRALDRANNSMISGAKRRIEEYALSLSLPSTVMFGLGILLPLMVGSFLPMLSWDMWSLEGIEGGTLKGGGGGLLQTVFLMNVLFPVMAFLVASNAVSRHPLETRGHESPPQRPWTLSLLAATSTGAGALAAWTMLDGLARSAGILLSFAAPFSAVLVFSGLAGGSLRREAHEIGDALFVTGARMLEGENFEAAIDRAASDLNDKSATIVRSLSFRSNIVGQDLESAIEALGPQSRSNALEALKVVQEAAAKDESDAGLLAMDLAAYLKDLQDLEDTLKGRLKPTISMMKMTAYALGPVVMGVTYAIYVSMGSMMAGGQGGLDPSLFALVLGAFLGETAVIVSYFVWGIEGKPVRSDPMFSIGTCLLTSELVFVGTAFLA